MINKLRNFCIALVFAALACSTTVLAGGPQLGFQGRGPVIDKSADTELRKLIREVAPQFSQNNFKSGAVSMRYNLFAPKELRPGEKYPLVLFMADASTPGPDVMAPLVQGYGALVWASPEFQSRHPCYVLAPQFSGVAVNDAYERTPEADLVLKMLAEVVKNNAVDPGRIYVTGQSMGGMLAMYYNIAHPGIFAASLFVDCHWDTSGLDKLVTHPFIFIYAGNKGQAWPMVNAIENAARKAGVGYAWFEWSAKLPATTQDNLAATELGKGNEVNLIGFESGTVLPESGKGSEHMFSFDYAYRLAPVRDWLFKHSLPHPALETR